MMTARQDAKEPRRSSSRAYTDGLTLGRNHGNVAAATNVIAGNAQFGVLLSGTGLVGPANNIILGNRIGNFH